MTFTEYINQLREAKRQPVGSVVINRNDVEWSMLDINGEVFTLDIQGELYKYLLPKDSESGVLYSIDKDGNKNRASCFKYVHLRST